LDGIPAKELPQVSHVRSDDSEKGRSLGAGCRPGGYSINAKNNVVINAAPTLPLAIEPPPHYAAEVAACMINEKYQSWLNEVGRQFIAQQEQLAGLQKQVAEAHERRTPLGSGL